MGWAWNSDYKGWNSKSYGGGRDKGQASKSPTPSWGAWRCECGNVQTGSQCKSCRRKWWDVAWTKVDPAKPTQQKPGWNQAMPPARPNENVLRFLDMILGQEEATVDRGALQAEAAKLREGIAGSGPAKSTSAKLKSALDKLSAKKATFKTLKGKIKVAQQELTEMEKQHDGLAAEVAALEDECTTLANQVAIKLDTDSETDEPEGDTSEGTHQAQPDPSDNPGSWAPRAKAKPNSPGHPANSVTLTHLDKDDLAELLRKARKEVKRRRLESSQGSSEASQTQDCDEASDEEM